MIFAFVLIASAAWGSPTQFFPVEDYRHVTITATDREPAGLPPTYQDRRAHFLSLELYVGVADRASSAFIRARYRVFRNNGEVVDVDTGLRRLGFADALLANQAVRLRAHADARKAVFANSPIVDFREPMFTEPSVVLFTGDSVTEFFHEISIAMSEDEFNRLDRDFDVEIRLKHQQYLLDEIFGINASRFILGRAHVQRIDAIEAVMINRLTYLAQCEAGLVAH